MKVKNETNSNKVKEKAKKTSTKLKHKNYESCRRNRGGLSICQVRGNNYLITEIISFLNKNLTFV